MYPWLWLWAPQMNFPWSGDVAQEIEPTTNWFFRRIRPAAGDAEIEQKAFSVASYGKQLGLITEVLIDVAEKVSTRSAESTESLNRLKLRQEAIDRIKTMQRASRVSDIASQVAEVQRKGGSEYAS